MALLNYTGSYSNISSYINATAGSVDWLKIFVSPDAAGGGHFITHGIDFGASYANGKRGLVPVNSGTLNKTFLRGDGWSAFWSAANETAAAVGDTDAQKLAAKEAYLQSTLASVYDIKQWIQQSFSANDAMRFKGKINIDGSGNITTVTDAGTTNGFPTSCEVGDTYKISGTTDGISIQIAGEPVNTGDLVICIKNGTGSINTGEYWTIVQDNVEHLITYTLNGTAFKLYAQTPNDITIYAPTTSGAANQVLISKGTNNAPEWANQATLVVGQAAKVANALVKGNGISMLYQGTAEASYDGSKQITLTLTPATTSVIGGVIIDSGNNSEKYNAASNTAHTLYPTITVKNTGEIYLTKENIINALGYNPISAIPVFTASANGLVPMASTANKQTNSKDNIASNATYVLGHDAKWYKLPTTAFSSTWREIKLNNTSILSTATSTPALNFVAGGHLQIVAEKSSNNYTGKLTFSSSWRDIQVHLVSGSSISNDVASIGDNDPLVFENSESIFMLGEQATVGSKQKTLVKSYITWYNMDTHEYEIV